MSNEPCAPKNGSFRGVLNAVVASSLVGLGGWTLTISQRVTKTETKAENYDRRIDALENGRTTPMAAETRAEFAALRRELADMRMESSKKDARIGDMHAAHLRLMERLIDTVKEKKL